MIKQKHLTKLPFTFLEHLLETPTHTHTHTHIHIIESVKECEYIVELNQCMIIFKKRTRKSKFEEYGCNQHCFKC